MILNCCSTAGLVERRLGTGLGRVTWIPGGHPPAPGRSRARSLGGGRRMRCGREVERLRKLFGLVVCRDAIAIWACASPNAGVAMAASASVALGVGSKVTEFHALSSSSGAPGVRSSSARSACGVQRAQVWRSPSQISARLPALRSSFLAKPVVARGLAFTPLTTSLKSVKEARKNVASPVCMASAADSAGDSVPEWASLIHSCIRFE